MTPVAPTGNTGEKAPSEPKPSEAGKAAKGAAKKPSSDPKAALAERVGTAVFAKVAIYAGGLSAGVGIKALAPKLLRSMIDKPGGRETVRSAILNKINTAMNEAGVSYGVDSEVISEAADALLDGISQGESETITRKIAEGKAPEPGEDGYLEYLMNPDNLPMHRLEDVSPNSKKCWHRMVHQGEVLVRSVAPKDGIAGQGVNSEKVEPPAPKRPPMLASLAGPNVIVEEGLIKADMDGACEENVSGQIRVVSELVIDSVDATTGNVPDAGVSKSSILVRGDVRSAYGVASAETVFVGLGRKGGLVEKDTRLTAKNAVVNGMVVGEQQKAGAPPGNAGVLEVEALCLVRETDGGVLTAGTILVKDDCRRSRVDADQIVGIGGSLVGGVAICRNTLLVAGDLGSAEGGSNTLIVVPSETDETRGSKQRHLAVGRYKKQLDLLQQKQEEIDKKSAKRAAVENYWSALVSEEPRPSKNSMEAKSLRQFRDMMNAKKALERQVSEINKAIADLQQEEEDQVSGDAVAIRVAGKVYLDAVFEARSTVSEDDLQTVVSYEVDGKRFRGHKLQDLLTLLSKQAAEYLQKQAGGVDERRQAIEKMFEGREEKPTGPQIKHRVYENPFTWGAEADAEEMLNVKVVAVVDTREPHTLQIVSTAVVKEVTPHTEIAILREGPKVTFKAGGVGSDPVSWTENPEILKALDEILLKGLTARRFFEGAPLPAEPAWEIQDVRQDEGDITQDEGDITQDEGDVEQEGSTDG